MRQPGASPLLEPRAGGEQARHPEVGKASGRRPCPTFGEGKALARQQGWGRGCSNTNAPTAENAENVLQAGHCQDWCRLTESSPRPYEGGSVVFPTLENGAVERYMIRPRPHSSGERARRGFAVCVVELTSTPEGRPESLREVSPRCQAKAKGS